MNYYEHHIRDYDAATAHLSWDQDLAYTRLLRWYYRKEQPIPADVKEACRQVRATTKAQRDAVQAVMSEFFVLLQDGWHKDTCDEAIAKYRAGEPEREAKKVNEDTRLARHRAERAELFRIINGAGLHRSWNAPIAELRGLAEKLQAAGPATPEAENSNDSNAPATQTATGTATPATATQSPSPISHLPLPTTHDVAKDPPPSPAASAAPATAEEESDGPAGREDQARNRGPDQPVSPVTRATAAVTALRSVGVARVNGSDPRLLALLERGAGLQHLEEAAKDALNRKVHDPFAYVLKVVQSQLDEAAAIAAAPKPATARNGRGHHSGSAARAARMAEASPRLVASGGQEADDFIDTEARDVTPRSVG